MSIANPKVTASIIADGVTVGLTEERLLFVGQKNGGSAVSGALVENILDDNSWDTLFGEDSPIAAAIRRARRRNPVTRFDAISLDSDGGATEAGGLIVIGGTTATEAGTITVSIGSEKFNSYEIAIIVGDTPTTVGDKIEAAVTADPHAVVFAPNTTGTLTLTAMVGGTFGNTIGVKVTGSVGGLTTTVTGMSGGATDPDLTGVFDVVGENRYQGIVWQFQDDIAEVKDFLDPRFNTANNILDGRAGVSVTDTFANLLTLGGTHNSRSLIIDGGALVSTTNHSGGNILEVPFTKIAGFMATRALRRTDGAVLGDAVIARSAQDAFGGIRLNSKPYFNTPDPDLIVPPVGNSFEQETEVEQLKDVGVFVMDSNRAGNSVITGEVVTTYTTDTAGNPDPTFTNLEYVDTATAAREFIVNNTRAQYPQYRAAGGALPVGVDVANEASVAAYVTGLNADLHDFALVNSGVGTVDGKAVDYDKLFKDSLVVTLNPVTGRFFIDMKLFIIIQARDFVYSMRVAFEV